MTAWHYHLDGRDKICQRYSKGYRVNFTFEGYSGADVILTPLSTQISQSTLQSHLDAGAVLIQVKHSRDFDASVVDQRLFESLLRMNTWNAQAYQCGLLITGKFENVNGHLYIDGHRSSLSWKGYKGAWEAWGIRGGFVHPVIDKIEFQDFIDNLGNKLFVGDPFVSSGSPKPRKKFIQNKEFTRSMTLRQKARLAQSGPPEHDLRHLLVNIDGLSSKTVDGIWKLMQAEKLPMNISGFVSLAVDGKLTKVKGIGPKIAKKVVRQLGYGEKDFG